MFKKHDPISVQDDPQRTYWRESSLDSYYRGLSVLVTGGCGFIGSNLVHRLVELGANVTVIDSLVPGCGWHHANLDGAVDKIRLSFSDMRDAVAMRPLIEGQRIVFNLAGEISHISSMRDPQRDLSLNASAQLSFLDVCRLHNPSATIVYASSRQVYGSARYLGVDELHPINPVDYNGVHKLTAEGYHSLLRNQFGVRTISLRLGNIYGPRQGIHQDCRGFIDSFMRIASTGEQLVVFGDGTQVRGMLYVDDAVDAFLRAGAAGPLASAVYNIGNPTPISLIDIARQLARVFDGPEPRTVPFPEESKAIDIGDFYQNTERARCELGWAPRVGFADGLKRTLDFFRPRISERLHAGKPPIS